MNAHTPPPEPDENDLEDDLDDEMTGVQGVCAAVSDVVATTFFAAADPTAWITEGTR